MADETDEKAANKAEQKKEKKVKKAAGQDTKAAAKKPRTVFEPIQIQLRKRYGADIVPALMKELGLKSRMQVPGLQKIVINLSTAEAGKNPKVLNNASDELAAITGQKAVITKAKKSISNFKLREGMPIGCMVTLRKERMWSFLERLIHLSLPRVRDFRGLSPRGFDGRGNYNMGLKEQIIFPEIDYDKADAVRGLNITICTSAANDNQGRALLEALGMPFRKR
jgi:large subunit ribosomal protein L5